MRTKSERIANDFDCELFALFEKAQRAAADTELSAAVRTRWNFIAWQIFNVRTPVQDMMSDEDLTSLRNAG